VSEAQREAEITRGEADAERNRIFAEALAQDPEFFEFYRLSLRQAYDFARQRALRGPRELDHGDHAGTASSSSWAWSS
jgi:regulator of protease activity HflC (stomatin/prohibitin superfamily)